jgi:hypothetical protein
MFSVSNREVDGIAFFFWLGFGMILMRNPLSGGNPRVSSLVIINPVNKRNESFEVIRHTAGHGVMRVMPSIFELVVQPASTQPAAPM